MGEWCQGSLADLIDVRHGFAFKGEFISDEPRGDVLLTPGNFAMGGGFKGGKFKYYHGPVPDDFVLNEGDLLVSMTDLSKQSDTLGLPAFVPSRSDGRRYLHNQRLGKVIVKDAHALDVRYLYYLLCSADYRHEVLASATGTTVKHTSPERIRRFSFVRPPLSEQRAIAHILGTLDDKIELNRRMSATLEAMARGLFKSWFVDFDPVRAKAVGRHTGLPDHLAALFPDTFIEHPDCGEIPEGWVVKTLADLADLNPESWTRQTRPREVSYVDLASTKWGRIDAIASYSADDAPSRAQRVLRPGDTIIGTVRPGNGSYALIAEAGLTGSTGFAALRPRASELTELTYLVATSPENIGRLAHLADGAAYPAVRPDAVAAARITKPRRHMIAQEFSRRTNALLGRIARSERESRTLAALREALLPELISGELRVRDAEAFLRRALP